MYRLPCASLVVRRAARSVDNLADGLVCNVGEQGSIRFTVPSAHFIFILLTEALATDDQIHLFVI